MTVSTLALFDLDNTLIKGDSDFLWGCFLAERGYVNSGFKKKHAAYLLDYEAGQLNILDFLEFSLEPLTRFSFKQLNSMHCEFMAEKIQPIVRPRALDWLAYHRENNHTLAMITATNEFVTAPIAAYFGIEHLMATRVQKTHERWKNSIVGVPCFQEGKITHLNAWKQRFSVTDAVQFFYSDSFNDLPLLNKSQHPIAVYPDEKLAHHAKQHCWLCLDDKNPMPNFILQE